MRLNKLILLSSLVLGCGFLTAYGTWKTNGTNIIPVFAYTNHDGAKYYNSIDEDALGSDLLTALQTLNASKRQKTVGYSRMWDYYDQTDPGSTSGTYSAFYRGTNATRSQMNKEHVWPKSHGGNLVEGDIHMPRPTLSSDNSSRGNEFYVEGKTGSNGWDPYADGMTESYRGDSARIIFYCVVAEPKLTLVDTEYHYTTNANPDNQMGKLSDLLAWNLKYPVQEREQTRNEAAEAIQGNRNPFIDHPEWACKIWGNYNENTRCACQGSVVAITDIKLNKTTAEVAVGKTVTINATVTPADLAGSVKWTSSNAEVATVSGGVVTGVKEGSVIIKASDPDNKVSASCQVTVTKSSSGGGSSSKGCGGSILAPSVIVSVTSILGVSLLLVKKYKLKKEQQMNQRDYLNG